jgi:hypothetical protein
MGRGEFNGPALLASAVGRLLVQEGRGDKALLLSQSDSLGAVHQRWAMVGEVVAGAEQSSEECG